MRVGLNDIDSMIANQIAERLCGPTAEFLSEDIDWGNSRGKRNWRDLLIKENLDTQRSLSKRKPSSAEKYTLRMRKKRDAQTNRRGLITFGTALLVAIYMLNPTQSHSILAWIAFLGLWVAGTGMGVYCTKLATQRRALNRELREEELTAVLPLLSLTRAERAYCDILLMIAAFEADPESRRTIRSTLAQVNQLLEDSRRLEKRRRSLLPVLGTNPVNELRTEQKKLADRIAEATDPPTRESMQESLQLVTTRLENSLTLEQALKRLNAQQESLVHALSTAQSALARMQVAPSVQVEMATREIKETVTQMNQQTIAVEQAVQELIAVRN